MTEQRMTGSKPQEREYECPEKGCTNFATEPNWHCAIHNHLLVKPTPPHPNNEIEADSRRVANRIRDAYTLTEAQGVLEAHTQEQIREFNKNLTHIIVRNYDDLTPIQFSEWIEGMRKHHPDLMAEKASLDKSVKGDT